MRVYAGGNCRKFCDASSGNELKSAIKPQIVPMYDSGVSRVLSKLSLTTSVMRDIFRFVNKNDLLFGLSVIAVSSRVLLTLTL